MLFKRTLVKVVPAASLLGSLAVTAQATLTFQFDSLVTGSTPVGPAPWATLTIQDAGANTVDMTLTHSATSAAGQFISTLWLNMQPYPGNPTIIENSPKIEGASFNQNGINAAGLVFDMKVNFETSNANNGANRVKPGQSVSWKISGTGLNENAFHSLSGGNRQAFGMIHVQGICGEDSGKVAALVPEPSSLLAFGALAAVAAARRKRRS